MNRPPRPHNMMNNFYQSPRPINYQWRPNHPPRAPFTWRGNTNFGAPDRVGNSEEHWCETCDRGFPSVELLHKHKQQHQKCNIDGCQFVAHPKVITKHIQMQHSSGLYKKIANLNNPEDIQRWREERRKKYPTKSNIQKKAAECKEKIERGEKMALHCGHRNDKQESIERGPGLKRKHSFDKNNQKQWMNRQNYKANHSSFSTSSINPKPGKKIPKIIPNTPTTVEKNKLQPFTGILNIEMDDEADDSAETLECSNGLFEEDDYEESLELPKETTSVQEPAVCGALTSLMCDYGTSDEETEEKENEVLNKLSMIKSIEPQRCDDTNKIESLVVNKPEIIVNDANISDDDGPEEVKTEKTNTEHESAQEPVIKEKPVKKIIPHRNQEKQNVKFRHKIPSTLLQKLLHKEIRQERNIILQCIRYIKKHNYFNERNQ